MKSCPTCNRTYPDDTLAFCLIDGSVLSAPFDAQTKRPYEQPATEPPRTEVIESPRRGDTIPSPRPAVQTFPSAFQQPARTGIGSGAKVLIAVGVSIVLVFLATSGFFLIRGLLSNRNSNENTSQNRPELSQTNTEEAEKDRSQIPAREESSPSPPKLDLSGTWEGTTDETPGSLEISESDTDSYDGVETISYDSPVRIAVEIEVDSDTRRVTINETRLIEGSGWNLGTNKGVISTDGKTMSGTARDVKGKTYTWSFSRK